MTTSPTPREQAISEAMDWLMRLQEEPDNVALHDQHQRWLDADEQHRDAWRHARHSWRLIGALPAAEPAPPAQARPARRGRWYRGAALAAAACLLLALLPTLWLHLRADYLTGTEETRLVTLPDGSRVHLGAASALRTDFDQGRRRVTLLRGEAFFDVTRDPAHPFLVRTDTLDVTVLGTRFNVAIGALSDTVSVASGRVRVADQHRRLADLRPGQQLSRYHDGEVREARLAVEDVGAWQQQRLFVVDTAIADVIAVLRRYDDRGILLADDRLGEQRVTGSFDLSAPEQALDNLVQPHQGRILSLPALPRLVFQ
ncbi:FecR family protein [Alloalcanivorax sp. C16-2]|uniref:FecR family protein n=1 Tax=Alloalcanivorax sp. C16-2 TaxID=3390052 RepID=UPI003970D209